MNSTTEALIYNPAEIEREFFLTNSSHNASFKLEESLVETSAEFKPVIDYLLLTILIVIMLSMGCEITKAELWNHVRRPIGICIGMFSQFIIMPLSAFSIMQSISVSGLYATGVLVISCCPGGVLSNAFAYFCDGDLSLSVAMTSFSTLLAMGMMPLNLWIYGRSLETEDLVIPYDKLALSLVSVTSPVAVGMIIRWKAPRIAYYITKVGSYIGIAIVLICIVLEVIVFPNMFTGVPGRLYGTVLCLPFIGLTLGYILAWVFRQNMKVRKTISIECGVQNVPTALTIISLSFPVELQEDIILLPWLYGFAMMTGCTCICSVYQGWKRWSNRKVAEEVSLDQEKNGPAVCQELEIDKMKLNDFELNPNKSSV